MRCGKRDDRLVGLNPQNEDEVGFVTVLLYALTLSDGSYFTGVTGDIARRLEVIQAGQGPYVTRDRLPAALAFVVGPFANFEIAEAARAAILPESSERFAALIKGDEEVLQYLEELDCVDGPLQYGSSPEPGTVPSPQPKPGSVLETNARNATRGSGALLDKALSGPSRLRPFLDALVGSRNADIALLRLQQRETLAAIAEPYGLTRERIRQLVARFGKRVRGAFRRSIQGRQLLDACRDAVTPAQEGCLTPAGLEAVITDTLGWQPDEETLRLLIVLLTEAMPSLQFSSCTVDRDPLSKESSVRDDSVTRPSSSRTMDTIRALDILSCLAEGCDPYSGEVLSSNSLVLSDEILQALKVAVQAMKQHPNGSPRSSPANAGKAWSTEEDQKLRENFVFGMPIYELAQSHQRTRGGVRSRLVKLGLLGPTNGTP